MKKLVLIFFILAILTSCGKYGENLQQEKIIMLFKTEMSNMFKLPGDWDIIEDTSENFKAAAYNDIIFEISKINNDANKSIKQIGEDYSSDYNAELLENINKIGIFEVSVIKESNDSSKKYGYKIFSTTGTEQIIKIEIYGSVNYKSYVDDIFDNFCNTYKPYMKGFSVNFEKGFIPKFPYVFSISGDWQCVDDTETFLNLGNEYGIGISLKILDKEDFPKSAAEYAESWKHSGHVVIGVDYNAEIAGLEAVTLEVDHVFRAEKYFIAYIQDGDDVIEIYVSGLTRVASDDQSEIDRLKAIFESVCNTLVKR